MIFSKEKEYFIGILPRHCLYVICTKIVKDKSGNVESISFKSLDSDQTLTYTIEEVNNFCNVIQPIDNAEFFTMYVNWNNFYKEGPHQDLDYAKQLALTILKVVKARSCVRFGSGAFVRYDWDKLEYLRGIYEN